MRAPYVTVTRPSAPRPSAHRAPTPHLHFGLKRRPLTENARALCPRLPLCPAEEAARIPHPARFLWLFLVVLLLLTVVTVSVPRLFRKSFAVETYAVGVYWDTRHTRRVDFIDWGELTPGAAKDVQVFVRNEEVSPSGFITFWTDDWTPSHASQDITLDWNYDDRRIPFAATIPVTFTLTVARIVPATAFSFTIIIVGTAYLLGDLNHDDAVNFFDLLRMMLTYNSTPADSNWNPEADLNNDHTVNLFDLILFTPNYGKSAG